LRASIQELATSTEGFSLTLSSSCNGQSASSTFSPLLLIMSIAAGQKATRSSTFLPIALWRRWLRSGRHGDGVLDSGYEAASDKLLLYTAMMLEDMVEQKKIVTPAG
jgi:hypothetical protein